jgi:membrane protease YdiL (CAAX protease family)
MDTNLDAKTDRLWLYIILPIVVLTLAAFLTYGVYYGLQATQPEAVAGLSIGQVVFGQYLIIAVVEWALALSIIRRLKRAGIPLMMLIAPDGQPWRFRWLPALAMVVAFNGITAGAMSTYAGLRLWQKLFLLVLVVVTASFCEELIWRGYIVTRLQARGKRPWAVILISAVAFALIHGDPIHWLFTFLVGLVTAWYYRRERNLVPLFIAHAIADLWSFVFFLAG